MIVDLANVDKSIFVTTFGQSEMPLSRFYGDIVKTWKAGEYFPMKSDVAVKKTQRLEK